MRLAYELYLANKRGGSKGGFKVSSVDKEIQANKAVRDLANKLLKLDKEFNRTKLKSLLRTAAKPFVGAAKANAPYSSEPHHRYSRGERVATYAPGHLRRSIRVLSLKRTPDILIAPKVKKRGRKTGGFDGVRIASTDAWYAHFVEYGTTQYKRKPSGFGFMRRAFDENKGIVAQRVERALNRRLKRWERANRR